MQEQEARAAELRWQQQESERIRIEEEMRRQHEEAELKRVEQVSVFSILFLWHRSVKEEKKNNGQRKQQN